MIRHHHKKDFTPLEIMQIEYLYSRKAKVSHIANELKCSFYRVLVVVEKMERNKKKAVPPPKPTPSNNQKTK